MSVNWVNLHLPQEVRYLEAANARLKIMENEKQRLPNLLKSNSALSRKALSPPEV